MDNNQNIETLEVQQNNVQPIPPKKKGNKGLIIFLILIILGMGGYITYDKVLKDKLFDKEEPKKVEKKEKNNESNINKEETKDDKKEQYITVNNNKYVDSNMHTVGKLVVAGKEYEIKYQQRDLSNQDGNYNFETVVYIGSKKIDTLYDAGIDHVAVLDNKYIYIKALNEYEWMGHKNYILDQNLNDVTESLGIYHYSINTYKRYDSNGNVIDNVIKRKIGYVDTNHIKCATYTYAEADDAKQTYEEYLFTFKDGKVTKEKVFSENNVFVSSQT